MTPEERLQQLVDKANLIEEKYIAEIERLSKSLTPDEFKLFISSEQPYELLRSLGVDEVIEERLAMLDDVLLIYKDKYTVEVLDGLEILQGMDNKAILGRYETMLESFNSKLYSSIIQGVTFQETKDSLIAEGYTNSHAGTLLQTKYYDFSRTATFKAFENNPDQKFEYEGGIIPTSSDECKWFMMNQKKEGYTFAEIAKGIKTPFIHTSGKLKGQTKIINQFGRNPNFNCIHKWTAIDG